MLIGITGGIGGGKTTLSGLLKNKGYLVFDTDASARDLQNGDAKIQSEIIQLFGKESYNGNTLNRKFVANIVFENPTQLSKLNAIIHPAVKDEIAKWTIKHQHEKMLFIECAILFEGSFDKLVDKTILVTAELQTRINRIMLRDNMTREQALNRINSQMPDEEKMKLVDYTIRTDDNTPLDVKIEKVLSMIIT